ncbi:Arc family DNA-binding protein [Rhizobium leguminosarum]|uniref:Arc family DNA-binding protein n=1 Tax=Rhizobium leguminosarum TaxID=384 RepID=UPI00098FB8F8|nr:Arc family DNA-binding protein [Rhizobium leguminosarum]MBB5259244.1 putative HicB family RNase H-like nuclease [Rhizobium leguminosarum]MDX6002539.1 Arc family DNA-binding protein [Rhizobium leguminosarum]PUB61974.1 Arc family DNA-binding protein [Rhizobium leguminosarum bv. viciae USDA 2370]
MTTRSAEKLMVRFSEGLKARIKEEAERNHRSMNSEIVTHLERAMFDPLEMKKSEAA